MNGLNPIPKPHIIVIMIVIIIILPCGLLFKKIIPIHIDSFFMKIRTYICLDNIHLLISTDYMLE